MQKLDYTNNLQSPIIVHKQLMFVFRIWFELFTVSLYWNIERQNVMSKLAENYAITFCKHLCYLLFAIFGDLFAICYWLFMILCVFPFADQSKTKLVTFRLN